MQRQASSPGLSESKRPWAKQYEGVAPAGGGKDAYQNLVQSRGHFEQPAHATSHAQQNAVVRGAPTKKLNVNWDKAAKTLRKLPPTPNAQERKQTVTEKADESWVVQFNELEFVEMVAAGSAGEVFLGYWFGTPVAIKKLVLLGKDEKQKAMKEYSFLKEARHPFIVQFLGICIADFVYLISEFVEGGDLFDLLNFSEKEKKPDWPTRVRIALQIAQAMYYLHNKLRIIHRDLKSQNVLLDKNQRVKLCDLGLATVHDFKLKHHTIAGTDQWLAPEIGTKENYDHRVDIFSFGIVLQELVTCKPPPNRSFANELRFNQEAFMPTIPAECPKAFTELLLQCVQQEPEKRPEFKDIVVSLRNLFEEMTG